MYLKFQIPKIGVHVPGSPRGLHVKNNMCLSKWAQRPISMHIWFVVLQHN